MRKRVTRVIVMEGEAEWIEETLKRSLLGLTGINSSRVIQLPNGATIIETSRTAEEIDA